LELNTYQNGKSPHAIAITAPNSAHFIHLEDCAKLTHASTENRF